MAQWLETPAIVVAVVAVLTILWKAAHWKGTVDEHRKTMDEHRGTVASFMKEVGEHRKTMDEHRGTVTSFMKGVDEHRKTMDEHRKTMDEHRGTVTSFMQEIRDKVDRIFERLPPMSAMGGSPLRLTDFGERISEWLDAGAWAADLAPRLRGRVEGKAPFEVDRFSREYVHGDEIGPEWTRRIAACAYEFGADESGVFDVLRIVLRDELLALLGHESKPPA